jgi:putative transport protein
MSELMSNNPLLLLFVVAALGYLLGKVKIMGSSLGVAAVLFVGLGFGALDPNYNVPSLLFQLGIILFVYSIGLSSGPAFFNSFKSNGWRDIGFIVAMTALTATLAVGVFFLFDYSAATITGIYAGSTTNTPALAGVLDIISNNPAYTDKNSLSNILAVGYTFSYPLGVIGVMAAIKIMEKLLKVNYKEEKIKLRKTYPVDDEITSAVIQITNPDVAGIQIRDLSSSKGWDVVFGRIKGKEGMLLSDWSTTFKLNDKVFIIGQSYDIEKVVEVMGIKTDDTDFYNRKEHDVRRIFVSNPDVVGQKISALNLNQRFHTVITRIRRGDMDMLAKADTVLEQGDRIQFIARRKDLDALSRFFGDSYYESSRINLFSFGLGIALGLIVGAIPIVLPGGIQFKLGFAGGPLVVGLLLGAIRRTGPIVWTLPYGADVTLRQLGLIILLAVIGIQSGNTFLTSFQGGEWALILFGAAIIAVLGTMIALYIGYKWVKIPFSLLLGFVSNQPAILDFSQEVTGNRVPTIGYSLMFPIALVMKILFAQLLFILLQ